MNQLNQMNQMNNLQMSQMPNGAMGGMPNVPGGAGTPTNGNMAMQKGMEKSLLNTYIYDYFLKHEMYACTNGNMAMQKGMEKSLLNTYIYDYFLKHEMYACAKAILDEAEVAIIPNSRKGSPRNQKLDAEGNPIQDDSMDTDRKDDPEGGDRRGDDMPLPKVPTDCPGGTFLYDWWALFWDIFGARMGRPNSGPAGNYVTAQRLRQENQQRFMMGPTGMPLNPQQAIIANGQIPPQMMNGQGFPNQMMRMPNGMMADGGPQMNIAKMNDQQNLVRQAMANQRKSFPPQNATPQQIAQMKNQQQLMAQQQMQRDHSAEGDMNGLQRPQSPAAGQTAPSPSKRPRTDGEFQGAGNGRGQPPNMQPTPQVSQAASQMLLSHGINPNQLTQQQFMQFQNSNPVVQQKSIQTYAQNLANHQRTALQGNIPKTMPNGQLGVPAAHGTPMMHQTSADGGPGPNSMEFYGSAPLSRGMSATGGNHALQDYQMQLMLLEQQNKKRLMMARAEQDQIQLRGNEPRPDGSVAFQGMSPSGSRAAPSPQPSQDMKRGTPKMGAQPGPGSPLPDGAMVAQRGSPAASIPGFNGPAGQDHQLFFDPSMNMGGMMNGQPGMVNGANMMRPPSSHPGFNAQLAPHMNEMNPAMRQQVGRGQPNPAGWNQTQAQHAQHQQAQQQMAQLQAQAAQQAAAQQEQQRQGGQPPMAGGQTPQATTAPTPGRQPGQHQSMPPPQAPAATQNGRGQPSSPQVGAAAPPTPTQSNKAAPRAKKDAKEPRGKANRATKKGAAAASAATPSEPPTPTPTTPMTPQHPLSFNQGQMNNNKGPAGAMNTNAASAPPRPPSPEAQSMTVPQAMPPTDLGVAFASIDGGDTFADLNFDNTDAIFDFDSFLNNPDDPSAGGGMNFDASAFFTEGVETGGDV